MHILRNQFTAPVERCPQPPAGERTARNPERSTDRPDLRVQFPAVLNAQSPIVLRAAHCSQAGFGVNGPTVICGIGAP